MVFNGILTASERQQQSARRQSEINAPQCEPRTGATGLLPPREKPARERKQLPDSNRPPDAGRFDRRLRQGAAPSGAAAGPPAGPGGPGGAPPPPPEVLVETPSVGQITDYEDFTGRTVASKTIEIRARVTGYIDKINFHANEGRDVEGGSVLFEIDPRPYEAEVARANANLLQAATRLKRVELDYDRAKKTVATRTITQEQFDQVAGDRAEAKAQVEIMKANLDVAQLDLNYTKVEAPISGRVSRTQLDQGNLVRADDTVLATIVAMDPMYGYFELDERTLLALAPSRRRAGHHQHPQ